MDHHNLNVIADSGAGRPFVILVESDRSGEDFLHLQSLLASGHRAILVTCPSVRSDNWHALTMELLDLLSRLGLRQASFVAFEAAGTVIQNVVLSASKLVRVMVLVNPTPRPHPTLFMRCADALERHLPLGLPLRLGNNGFDALPFLQRMRCPTLLLTTEAASHYVREQTRRMAQALPTAWWGEVGAHIAAAGDSQDDASSMRKLLALIVNFQDVPAKAPQKNSNRNGAGGVTLKACAPTAGNPPCG